MPNRNPSASSPGSAALTRTIVVCDACGCDPGDEPAPKRGCPNHGVDLVEVEILRASALGLEMPPPTAPAPVPHPTTEQLLAAQRLQGDVDDRRRSQRLEHQAVQHAAPSLFGGVTEAA
jgi:hypothetical protein